VSRSFAAEVSFGGCAERERHAAALSGGCWLFDG
jgi:hypothetical protein